MLNASSRPRSSPAATAAMLLPRPPRMATVKPLMASAAPMSYWVWVSGEITQPASAPMPALSMKDSVTILPVVDPAQARGHPVRRRRPAWPGPSA